MPSGKTHDRLTTYASLAVLPAATFYTIGNLNEPVGVGVMNGAIACLSCLVSGLWLSTDVDCSGYLKRRYGMFRLVWWGYYTAAHWGGHYRVNGRATHRSHLSHSPLIGTASKVAYLAAIAALILPFAGVEPQAIAQFIQAHSVELMWSAIGFEVGSLVHIVSDWVWSELH
jgi:uncharacterized metal-binding protein